jgi:CheY-like chemotaxis protein
MAAKKILVIEDEPVLRKNILAVLQFEDYEVLEAEDGAIGVELARTHLPDLILCDIRMPHLDGYEVLSVLRSDSLTAVIPVVFTTAKANRQDIERGIELGVNAYLTKPFQITELLQVIRDQF